MRTLELDLGVRADDLNDAHRTEDDDCPNGAP